MNNRKAFLKQVIDIEEQSLAAHKRELELLTKTELPKQRTNHKDERQEKYRNRLHADLLRRGAGA